MLTTFMAWAAMAAGTDGADAPADRLGIHADDARNGALVRSVAPGSAAAAINLHSGDLVFSVNGQPVTEARPLAAALQNAGARELVLGVRRGANDSFVRLRPVGTTSKKPFQDRGLGAVPLDGGVPNPAATASQLPPKLGIGLTALEPQYRFDLGLRENEGGRIVSMTNDLAAAAAGMKPNDILLTVNGKPVSDNYSVMQALDGVKPNVEFQAELLRQGRRVPVALRLRRESFPPEHAPAAAAGGNAAGSEALFARLRDMEKRIQTLEDEVRALKSSAAVRSGASFNDPPLRSGPPAAVPASGRRTANEPASILGDISEPPPTAGR